MSTSVSFVCAVEAGGLEVQTRRLVESLRRHGGRHADAPFYAITPRLGPPLQRKTLEVFERYGVHHFRRSRLQRFDWFNFINKPRALAVAEEHATTDVMCWLDSDLLILGELEALDMPDEDFIACASDKEMGTTGPGDTFEPLWVELCRVAGLKVDDLPWLTTQEDHQRIRLYWNGGFFAYRRASGFGAQYLRICQDLLEARVISSHKNYGVGINEMSALGLAMVRCGLRWRELPYTYNHPIGTVVPEEWHTLDRARLVKVLHYHDGMWPWYWNMLIERVRETNAEAVAWLEPLGPIRIDSPVPIRLATKVFREFRRRQERIYRAGCRAV